MQTQILANSWVRTQAMHAEQQDDFRDLDNQPKDFIKQIQIIYTKLEDLIRSEATRSREHTTAEADRTWNHFTAQFLRTTDRLKQEADKQEQSARWAKLLDSLAFPEMNSRKITSSIDAYHDTFLWIFDEDNERAWDSFLSFLTSQEQKLYWISGKPGSGKSTMMKFLIGHDKSRELLEQWSTNPLIISYFFWLRGSSTQRSTKELLSSLIHQILESNPDIIELAAESFMLSKNSIDDWSLPEL